MREFALGRPGMFEMSSASIVDLNVSIDCAAKVLPFVAMVILLLGSTGLQVVDFKRCYLVLSIDCRAEPASND